MSKNNLQVYIHVVFATKNRNSYINANVERILYPFMWKTILEHGSVPIMINGMPDHIHILFKLDSKISLAVLMKFIKGKSSRFLNEHLAFSDGLQWQRGYGAFSVSPENVDNVAKYIQNQKKHHQQQSIIDGYELS